MRTDTRPRFRRHWAFIGGVLAAIAGLVSKGEPQETPTFPSGVELVRIDVVVVDKDGKPVTGLTAADFEITEGGRRHEIASFEPVVVQTAPRPPTEPNEPPVRASVPLSPVPGESRHFLVVFDDFNIGPVSAERVRAQLVPFLERATRAGDWVTIVAPGAGLQWTARTPFERLQIPAVVRGLKARLFRNRITSPMSDFDAMQIVEFAVAGGAQAPATPGPNSRFALSPTLTAAEVYATAKHRARQSLGGLAEALQSLATLRGRKSLLLYSEGFIKSPSVPDYDRVIDLARRAHVAVYVIDPRGLRSGLPGVDGDSGGPNPLIDLDTNGGGTSYVATATGGRASMSNDVTAVFREAAIESAAYYLIGFQPSAGGPGERKLKVRVHRDGLRVRAPDRYFVGNAQPPAKATPPAVQALGQLADATDIPMRVATLFLDERRAGEPTTTLAVELPGSAGDMDERRLTLLVEARPLGEGEPFRDTADVTIPPGDAAPIATRELHLHSGVWQARVVVRDPRTEKLGSVLHTFEVPGSAGLRVSTPILGDRLEKSRVPRARLRLDRRFRRSDALYCQYRVFGAALDPASHRPRVTGSYAMLGEGRPVQEGPPSLIEPTSDGDLRRLIGFGLADLQPGDYTLVLRVTDQVGGEAREVRERFVVE